MIRHTPHVEFRTLPARFAAMAAAALFGIATIATLVEAMPPLRDAAAVATATEVTIEPSRIEVVGVRAASKPAIG